MYSIKTIPCMVLIALLAVTARWNPVRGQVQKTILPPAKEEKVENRVFQEKELLESARIIMSGPIDAEQYLLGPGDELLITIAGISPEAVFPLTVLPEGVINIPNIGSSPVTGMTLAETQRRIKKRLSPLYPGSAVDVTLKVPRIFLIRLTGEIKEPGIRYANATWRVSDVIDQSGGMRKWSNGSAVEIRHSDGTVDYFNAWEYYNYGRQSNNPFLRDGDEVYVPGRDFAQGIIAVQSSILRSGYYQFLEGETALEFIRRGAFEMVRTGEDAVRFDPTRPDSDRNPIDLKNVFIRRKDDSGRLRKIPLSLMPDGDTDPYIGSFVLQPDDILILPTIENRVYVEGEVANQGSIPWVANWRASQYVGIAGRTADAAGDKRIVVTRKDTNERIVGKDPVIYLGDHIFVPKKRQLQIKEWLDFVTPFVSMILAGKAIGLY